MFSKRRGSEDGVRSYVKYSLSCITAGDGEGEKTSILLASLYSACFFLLVFISLLAEATLFIIMLKGLFWQGEQRNRQFWLSMHFPLRQRSDHCSLSSKVALVVDRFAFFFFFGTVSPKRCWIPEREQAEAAHVPSVGVRREAGRCVPLLRPPGFPVALLSVTLSLLKAEF